MLDLKFQDKQNKGGFIKYLGVVIDTIECANNNRNSNVSKTRFIRSYFCGYCPQGQFNGGK